MFFYQPSTGAHIGYYANIFNKYNFIPIALSYSLYSIQGTCPSIKVPTIPGSISA